jgi:hypothetical protein
MAIKGKAFFGGITRKRPAISEKNRIKRPVFAKKYLNMPPAFWNKIIWSDEWKFDLIKSKRRTRVCKKRKEELNKDNFSATVKYPPSVMVWGCVSASGIGNLVEINTIIDTKHYVEIINSTV